MAKDHAIVVRKRPGGFLALLLVSCLVVCMSAAGAESRRVRVTLSAEAHSRAEALSPRLEDWKQGVLALRVVDPGRLVVKAGAEVIAAAALGWGEDQQERRVRAALMLEDEKEPPFEVIPGSGHRQGSVTRSG